MGRSSLPVVAVARYGPHEDLEERGSVTAWAAKVAPIAAVQTRVAR